MSLVSFVSFVTKEEGRIDTGRQLMVTPEGTERVGQGREKYSGFILNFLLGSMKRPVFFLRGQAFDTMLISFLCHSISSISFQPPQPAAITNRSKRSNLTEFLINSEVRGHSRVRKW